MTEAYRVFRYTDPYHRGLGFGVRRVFDDCNVFPLRSMTAAQAEAECRALNAAFNAGLRNAEANTGGRFDRKTT